MLRAAAPFQKYLDGFLNEKHGDVVGHNVPVAFIRVELEGKASDVSNGVCATTAALHG
jgi:hypothetical protein